MITRQPATLSLVYTFIVLLQSTKITSIRVQTISHTLPFSTKLFQDTHERPSARLAYGSCDTNDAVYDRNCTFVVETDAPPDSSDHLRFCDIIIRSSSIPMNAVNYLYPLNENITIVQWTNHYRRFAIVNFTDCKIVYPKLNDDVKISLDLIRAPFNGTFDVIVQDNRRGTPCLRGKWCRMMFDFNGKILEHPRNWINEDDDIVDMVRATDGGRLVIDMNHNGTDKYIRLYKAYDSGIVRVLKKYPVGNLHVSSKKITVSTTHQLVTICALNYTNLTCGQFDYNGVLKLETHFKPLDFSNLHSAKVFNRRHGGFILLTLNCSKYENSSECHSGDEKYFTVRIFDAKTKVLKSLTIAQLKCSDEFNLDNIHLVSNVVENFCLSYVCDRRDTNERVSVEVNCFTKKDLDG